ncbi:3642_t:CDS:2, partial [Racocetra persica]
MVEKLYLLKKGINNLGMQVSIKHRKQLKLEKGDKLFIVKDQQRNEYCNENEISYEIDRENADSYT